MANGEIVSEGRTEWRVESEFDRIIDIVGNLPVLSPLFIYLVSFLPISDMDHIFANS